MLALTARSSRLALARLPQQLTGHSRSRLFASAATISAVSPVVRSHRSCLPSSSVPLHPTAGLLPCCSQPHRSIQQRTAGPGPEYVTSTRGSPQTESFRLYFHHRSDPSRPLSPWHDIPLLSTAQYDAVHSGDRLYHYVNEIPRGTTAKMEVATGEAHNPIAQDVKKGRLRHFTYGDIPFNYGCLPQTWEDPTHTDPQTGCLGDNDPVDVVELSREPLALGSVHSVRVLGVLALIDEGETDWKLLAVNSSDPLYNTLRSLDDVERQLPGVVDGVRQWFKQYKTTDGKPVNVLAFDERVLGEEEAEDVIDETHRAWRALVDGKRDGAKLWLRDGKVEGRKATTA